MTGLLIRIYHC